MENNLTTKEKSKIGIDLSICEKIAQIRNSRAESSYERYKILLSLLTLEKPRFFEDLSYLHDIRNALVHFRSCDIRVIEDTDGVIRHYQEPPEVFKYIKSHKIKGWPVIAADVKDNSAWNLRISTNAMALWSMDLILNAIIYALNTLPKGTYKDHVFKFYRKENNPNLFEEGKCMIQEIENKIF